MGRFRIRNAGCNAAEGGAGDVVEDADNTSSGIGALLFLLTNNVPVGLTKQRR